MKTGSNDQCNARACLHYHLNLVREVRESLDAGQFAQFRWQFKADRAGGV